MVKITFKDKLVIDLDDNNEFEILENGNNDNMNFHIIMSVSEAIAPEKRAEHNSIVFNNINKRLDGILTI